jgi:glutamine synthetase
MSVESILKTLKDEEYNFVDIRFTDTIGKEQHVTVPTHEVDE